MHVGQPVRLIHDSRLIHLLSRALREMTNLGACLEWSLGACEVTVWTLSGMGIKRPVAQNLRSGLPGKQCKSGQDDEGAQVVEQTRRRITCSRQPAHS